MSNIKKFLIIGMNGLIGERLYKELLPHYSVVGTYFGRPVSEGIKCDITTKSSVEAVFNEVKPTHVIHCANLAGGTPYCQKMPEEAERFHFQGTKNVAQLCIRHNAKFIFLSTECVFDGKREEYAEGDSVNPLSVYGRWKAESEEWIINKVPNHVIVRTMAVFGWQPQTKTPNAVMNVFFEISKNKKIHIPVFRMCQPTYVRDLARAVRLLCKDSVGLFHFSGCDYVSRYEWLKYVSERLGWDATLLIPHDATTEGDSYYPRSVKFNCQKYLGTFPGESLGTLDEALTALGEEIKACTALSVGNL